MPPRNDDEDDWDEGFESSEGEDEFDAPDEEDEEPTIACPHCRRQIHQESQRCPYCGHYLSEEDSPPNRKPWWLIFGVLVCLYVVYRWIAG